jgi:hypothetical protein
MTGGLQEYFERFGALSTEQQRRTLGDADRVIGPRPWIPNLGPQTELLDSAAFLALFGGQGGGGKSSALLGLALTQHRRSLVMRRHYTDLSALTADAITLNGGRAGFKGAPPPRLRTRDGRLVEFGAAAHLGDERQWQGQPHDFLGIDEAVQFLEAQVRFLLGWVRTTEPGQRCRAVLASNPPIDASGQWIIGMFRPWLDLTHPNPAKPGELRWFVTDPDGKDREVADSAPVEIAGRRLIPLSRTFIPATLGDNPFLASTGYQAQLDSLPEPLRSAVRDGNFMAAREDDEFQVIPTDWIVGAQSRWRPDWCKGNAMTALAIDPAGGGRDEEVIATRYSGWFGPLTTTTGPGTAEGSGVAARVVQARRNNCAVVIDVGGGYGGGALVRLRDNGIPAFHFNGAQSSSAKTRDGKLAFVNKRAEAWWRMREELDPDQEGGSAIMLPPDRELMADLAAPTWRLTPRGIVIESKDEIRRRLGRSPGKGDAVVMALSEGTRAAARAVQMRNYSAEEQGLEGRGGDGRRVLTGHESARRRR